MSSFRPDAVEQQAMASDGKLAPPSEPKTSEDAESDSDNDIKPKTKHEIIVETNYSTLSGRNARAAAAMAPPTEEEIKRIELKDEIRSAIRELWYMPASKPSANPKKRNPAHFNPFEDQPTYLSKEEQQITQKPDIRKYGLNKAFFPPELHNWLDGKDSDGEMPAPKKKKNKAVKDVADSKSGRKPGGATHSDSDNDTDKIEDDDFSEDDDDAGDDYNAEKYFEDGEDDGEGRTGEDAADEW